LEEVTKAGARVVVVSFGSPQGAACWLNETQCKLEMFLDQERSLYQAFGLTRSLSKVWSMPMIHIYAEKIVGGEIFPESKDEDDDPLQMGGDFTLSRSGHLLLSHRSSNPYDRPSLRQILDAAAVQRTRQI